MTEIQKIHEALKYIENNTIGMEKHLNIILDSVTKLSTPIVINK